MLGGASIDDKLVEASRQRILIKPVIATALVALLPRAHSCSFCLIEDDNKQNKSRVDKPRLQRWQESYLDKTWYCGHS